MHFAKTRIAPTPSGFLHIGNAYSFALTAAIAKKFGASLLLRIDDMDRDRVNTEYVDDIFETLNFLGISWDEGPRDAVDFDRNFSQRLRLQMYESYLKKLVNTGKVYACNCSRKQIDAEFGGIYPGACKHKNIPLDADGVAWRIDTDDAKPISVRMLDGNLQTELPNETQHFVIRKKDGFPAYQLTSLADDLHFSVDLIIRGEDLWPSTLAQLFLANLIDADSFLSATFYHHPLLTDNAHRKLSKSAGDISIAHFRNHGLTAKKVYSRIGEAVGYKLDSCEDFIGLIPT